MFDFSIVTDAVLSVHSEDVVVTTSGGSFTVRGCHTAPSLRTLRPDRAPYQELEHKVLMRAADFAATGGRAGDTLTIQGIEYRIVDLVPEPDSGSMTAIVQVV